MYAVHYHSLKSGVALFVAGQKLTLSSTSRGSRSSLATALRLSPCLPSCACIVVACALQTLQQQHPHLWRMTLCCAMITSLCYIALAKVCAAVCTFFVCALLGECT